MGALQISKGVGAVPFLLLAAGLSFSVLAAAKNYGAVAERARNGSDARVACQYVRMKARQSDREGYISVHDDRMVYMLEEFPEGEFVTDLYSYEGWLMECLHGQDVVPGLSAGDRVLPCDEMHVSMDGQVLTFSTDSGGKVQHGAIFLHGGEAGP